MQTAPATVHTNGKRNLMRMVLMTVAIALLGMTLMPPAARAESADQVREDAMWQQALCEAVGGTATTTVIRTVEGISDIFVSCTGGALDGVKCWNGSLGPVVCNDTTPRGVLPIVTNVIDYEFGSVYGIEPAVEAITEELQSDQDVAPPADERVPVTGPSVVSPDDQHQDQDHHTGKGKSKHGKKGKKSGKGRK